MQSVFLYELAIATKGRSKYFGLIVLSILSVSIGTILYSAIYPLLPLSKENQRSAILKRTTDEETSSKSFMNQRVESASFHMGITGKRK